MADLRISELPVLNEADLQANDDLAVVDYSASETRRLTAKALVEKGVTLIDDGSIPGAKIVGDSITAAEIAPDAIGSSELADDSVDTAAIQDDAVTNAKLATDAVTQDKVADDAIGEDELAVDAVVTASIQDKQVTAAKIADDTITAAQIAPDAIGASELANDSVDENALQSAAVTTVKIDNDAVTQEKIADDAVGADQLATDAVVTASIVDDAVTTDKIASGAVKTDQIEDDAVTGAKLGAVTNRGLDQTGDKIGITNSVTAGSLAGLTFDEHGLITAAADEIPSTDLPEATVDDIGAIKPGDGLAVEADGTLNIDNNITAGDIGGLSFTAEGLCNGFPAGSPPVFERDCLPIAGDEVSERGVVFVPTDPAVGIELDATTGELGHEESGVSAGTYAGVTVDENGHITAGTAQITGAQLPDAIPAADIDISDGRFPTVAATSEAGFTAEVVTEAIADQSIGRRHFNDISTAYIQEAQPTSTAQANSDATVFRGCLWFRESTGQLYMFNGNAWHIVAGGRLASENLRFCGTINANTGNITSLTDEGVAEQDEDGNTAFTAGNPLPGADDALSGCYFLVDTDGSNIDVSDVTGNSFTTGDLCIAISKANGWLQVTGAFGGGGGGGSGLWKRSGSAPNAILVPDNAADNVDLNGSDFLRLPSNGTTAPPPGGKAGSFRWNSTETYLQVYDGSNWLQVTTLGTFQWETIAAADNPNWTSDIIRTTSTASDLAIRPGKALVFEQGTGGGSGNRASSLQVPGSLAAGRTWTLPDETGTLVSTVSTVDGTDTLTIDCGTYA